MGTTHTPGPWFVRWVHQAGSDLHGWRDSTQPCASLEAATELLAKPFKGGVRYGQVFRVDGGVNVLVARRDRIAIAKAEGK